MYKEINILKVGQEFLLEAVTLASNAWSLLRFIFLTLREKALHIDLLVRAYTISQTQNYCSPYSILAEYCIEYFAIL